MRFLILGATGMAGHTIALFLKEQGHEVTAYTRKPFAYCRNIIGDAVDFKLLEEVINNDEYDAIINAVGILNNDAENNKSRSVLLNSYLPHFLSDTTKELKTKVIHMSTDCVFSGRTGSYTEAAFKDGETFYDRTKALGELVNNKDITFRNSIIGPDRNENGIGLFNWFMKQREEIKGYNKVIWSGVTTLTLAKAIEESLAENLTGLYNLVNNEVISKYELLRLFNKYFKNNQLCIKKCDDVVLDKSLVNSRTDFKFQVPSYEDMISEMRDWLIGHKSLYPHYNI